MKAEQLQAIKDLAAGISVHNFAADGERFQTRDAINVLVAEVERLQTALDTQVTASTEVINKIAAAKVIKPELVDAVVSNQAVRVSDVRELIGELLADMQKFHSDLAASKDVTGKIAEFIKRLGIQQRELSKVQVLDSAVKLVDPGTMVKLYEARSEAANECLTERKQQEASFQAGRTIESSNAGERATYQGGIWEGLSMAIGFILGQ